MQIHLTYILDQIEDLLLVLADSTTQESAIARLTLKDLRSYVERIYDQVQDAEDYDTYISDLQRQIQQTAPWLFNHYVDPEDLLDSDDSDGP